MVLHSMKDNDTDWVLAIKQLIALLLTVPAAVGVAMYLHPAGDLLSGVLWGVLLSFFTWLAAVRSGLFGNSETANYFVN